MLSRFHVYAGGISLRLVNVCNDPLLLIPTANVAVALASLRRSERKLLMIPFRAVNRPCPPTYLESDRSCAWPGASARHLRGWHPAARDGNALGEQVLL